MCVFALGSVYVYVCVCVCVCVCVFAFGSLGQICRDDDCLVLRCIVFVRNVTWSHARERVSVLSRRLNSSKAK